MNVVVIIMHLVNGSVVEASVSATVPKLLCTEAVQTNCCIIYRR